MAFSPLDSELFGPLFATPSMAAEFSDRAIIAAMLRAEAALARALARHGLASPELAPAIERLRPEDFDLAALGRATALAGVAVIPFVRAVQAKLPAALEPAFHKGATTQDIADTALVLQMRRANRLLADESIAVIDGLATLAERHRATPCIGRTYMQHAAPLSFGFKAAIWLAGFAEAAARLARLQDDALYASLGGAAGTLHLLLDKGPAVARDFAAELGLHAAPIAWHTRRTAIAEIGGTLACLIGALGKMAADVVHLASTEVGEVAEPYESGRGGSSAMPHKRNPVAATAILAAAGAAPGLAATLFAAMPAAHERPAGAWAAEWHALPSLFGLAAGALSQACVLAKGMTVDPERMRRNIEMTRGQVFADAAAAALAPGMGRGPAHALLDAAATQARMDGTTLQASLLAHPGLPASADRTSLAAAFDLTAPVAAAASWVAPAIDEARRVRGLLAAIR
jgi:3-carboxy-cis,cis-muconate cycloisomerase